ncbi:MAG: TolC family protein [Ahrensia sp.]|nr:TolC family protein [Ahrensia sp.]
MHHRTVDAAVEGAMSAPPKIPAMQHDAAAAEYAVGTARSAIMPTLDVELSANYRDRIAGTSAENANLKAMLVLKMSLYNGGINAARIREAKHRSEEARSQAEAVRLDVSREIRLAWNRYQTYDAIVKTLKSKAASKSCPLEYASTAIRFRPKQLNRYS